MHDVFGNSITLLEFADAGEPSCGSRAGSRSRQFGLDQPDYHLAADAARWPFAYDAEDRRDLGPTLDRHYPGRGRAGPRLGAGAPGRRRARRRSSC